MGDENREGCGGWEVRQNRDLKKLEMTRIGGGGQNEEKILEQGRGA